MPLDRRLGKVDFIRAGAILEDGSPALVLDMNDLFRAIETPIPRDRSTAEKGAPLQETVPKS
jgi:chemotaxis protein histidine kinase CheA